MLSSTSLLGAKHKEINPKLDWWNSEKGVTWSRRCVQVFISQIQSSKRAWKDVVNMVRSQRATAPNLCYRLEIWSASQGLKNGFAKVVKTLSPKQRWNYMLWCRFYKTHVSIKISALLSVFISCQKVASIHFRKQASCLQTLQFHLDMLLGLTCKKDKCKE